jgi:ribonuclease P protein component
VTASRKVGPAVVRNRLRRRVREIFRRWPDRARLGNWDLVVHLNTAARTTSFAELQTELLRLLRGIDRKS